MSGRIHILGVGNVGTFIAYSLATRPFPPPMTLMLHRESLYQYYLERKRNLAFQQKGLDNLKTGFDVNVLRDETWYSIPYSEQSKHLGKRKKQPSEDYGENLHASSLGSVDNSIIDCLIVAVKAPATVAALKSVKSRLTRDSTVVLVQNGLGILEEVNQKVFPDADARPNFVMGIITHGLRKKAPFHVAHAGFGTTVFAPVKSLRRNSLQQPEKQDDDLALTTRYVMRSLELSRPLVAFAESPSTLLGFQLEKLAMNCVINPLTAIMDCENGELLYNYSFSRIMRMILIEVSSVICALPELQGVPGIQQRFSVQRLQAETAFLANKTARNFSSMLQDVRSNTETEIEYINGYIIRRGEELGIKCAINYMIKHMVIARAKMLRGQEAAALQNESFTYDG